MQVAHNWNKSGNNYMTPSFRGATNITSIAISQKSPLTGTMGELFHVLLCYCSSLTSLDVPDTSGLTSVGDYFMYYYAYGCSSLTSLDVPRHQRSYKRGGLFHGSMLMAVPPPSLNWCISHCQAGSDNNVTGCPLR